MHVKQKEKRWKLLGQIQRTDAILTRGNIQSSLQGAHQASLGLTSNIQPNNTQVLSVKLSIAKSRKEV